MDELTHRRFEDYNFPEETTQMFAEILAADSLLVSVLLFITKTVQLNKQENIEITGVTVNQITNEVIVKKPVKHTVKNKRIYFEKKEAPIDRKHAERLLQNLLKMSLCYYSNPSGRTYFYYPTIRGIQVLQRAIEIKNQVNNKEEN